MGQPVNANGRSILHKGHGMSHVCAIPDVCKTPSPGGPVPIPYINVAMDSNLNGVKSVRIEGNPIANVAKKIITSTGDEPGTIGGIISNRVKGTMSWKMGSLDVKAEGKSVVRFLDPAFHNGNTFNTAFINQGLTGWAYGDDSPCDECGKPFAKHRVHVTEFARSKADQLISRMNEIYAEQEMDLLEAFQARETVRLIAREEARLREQAFQQFAVRGRALRQFTAAADFNVAIAELLGWAATYKAIRDGALARVESRRLLKKDDKTGVFTKPIMVGIAACICGDHQVGACSGEVTPGFRQAVEDCGLRLVDDMPQQSDRQKANVEADARVKNWNCAAPKLINALEGHQPKFMIECWYERVCMANTHEVHYHLGSERRTIEQQLVRAPTEDKEGVPVAPVQRYDGKALTSADEETFKSGDTVPSCSTCQKNLPEMLCEDKLLCPSK